VLYPIELRALCERYFVRLIKNTLVNRRRGMQAQRSLISERQIIQVDAVRILLVIAIHLVIDGHAIPVGGR
jgi:hypothetical protein